MNTTILYWNKEGAKPITPMSKALLVDALYFFYCFFISYFVITILKPEIYTI